MADERSIPCPTFAGIALALCWAGSLVCAHSCGRHQVQECIRVYLPKIVPKPTRLREASVPVECFWLEPTDRIKLYLRRYASGSKCPGTDGYHHARNHVGQEQARWSGEGASRRLIEPAVEIPRTFPHWPAQCAACGYRFQDTDEWQLFQELIYTRADGGGETTIRDAPPGAMWDAWWYPWKGPDGRSLMVKCPDGHDWSIDSRASNCTLPNDTEHRCWLRTGEPPRITVSKAGPGRTCSAGGGSIGTPGYHGFLRDGCFT